MKTLHKVYVFCLLSLGIATASHAQQMGGGGAEKTVVAHENQWLQALRTSSPDLVAPLLADKIVATGVDGKVTHKAELLADIKATKWTSAEYENVQVTMFANTAIVTGGFKGKGTDAQGKALNDHLQWTDTWVKMPDGKWQCVASQDTRITQ